MPIAVALQELPADSGNYVETLLPLSADPHRRRAQGFKSVQRRAEFLTGRRLLALLYQHLGIEFSWPEAQELSAPPAVITSKPAASTISHSGNLVLAAVGTGIDHLGIDCEGIERSNDLLAIARRHFCPREAARIEAAPEAERQPLFLRHWVHKEAWLKATGQGISGGFSTVELLADNSVRVHPGPHGQDWHFRYGAYRDHPLALCWGGSAQATLEFFGAEQILSDFPVLTPSPHFRALP